MIRYPRLSACASKDPLGLRSEMNILGQDNVKKFLESRIENLPSTMLFCGPEGTGKINTARELSRVLGYQFHAVIPDGDTYKVRQIRELLDKYRKSSKIVFAIEDADRLQGSASSLLLKTLEYPKDEVIFVLTAKEYAQVSYTLYSRCVTLEFNTLDETTIREYLQSTHKIWNDDYAKISNGSLKLADSVAAGDFLVKRNQVWSFLSEIKYLNEDNLSVPEYFKNNTEDFCSIALNLLYDILKVIKAQDELVVNVDLLDEFRSWIERYSFDYAIFAVICLRELFKNIPNFYSKDLHLKTLILKLKLGSVPI